MRTPLLFSVMLAAFMLLSLTNTHTYNIGDIAHDFSLRNVDGDTISLSDYQGSKGVIVIFTCNHCPFAKLYEDRIIELNNKFAPLGYPVIAINPNSPIVVPDDSFEKMQEHAAAKNYQFPYLFDEHQTVYPKFGATRTPHVFVLDQNRVVRYIGAIDNNPEAPGPSTKRHVELAVNALLNGGTPPILTTKSVGCTIKKAPAKPVKAVPVGNNAVDSGANAGSGQN